MSEERREIVELFGVDPGRNWVLVHDQKCPFSGIPDHRISKHPRQPFFWCVQCHRGWLVRGINPIIDQRMALPV